MYREDLKGLNRCPHCGIANPQMISVWSQIFEDHRISGNMYHRNWATFQCTSCKNLVLCESDLKRSNTTSRDLENGASIKVVSIFPDTQRIIDNLPDSAEKFLKQALDSMHAPDGAVMLCASAIDSMLKEKGYKDGNLYSRINEAAENNLITQDMKEWADAVRLEANNTRHADEERPHMTQEDAKQVFTFANALGTFLYELPAKIEKGKAAAEENKSATE